MLSSRTEGTPADKASLRVRLKQMRGELSKEKRAECDRLLCRNILSQKCVTKASTVLVFCPIKNEPDILPLVDKLVKMAKKVAFPISHPDTLTLEFKYANGKDELVGGIYGTFEPRDSAQSVEEFSQDTVCLVPALAFDKNGMRIGYGKGYYDRFLAAFRGTSIGVAYNAFVLDTIPHESTDVPVDMIITEGGVVLPNEKTK